ncbi:TULIP family P47-like protein [Klebsiella sp. MISC125]|uniref:TULIP family P47-like protein n=1 Tax=Klebsiella sp. MISC125 TaxID=2755386 RepID=UPI003DA86148
MSTETVLPEDALYRGALRFQFPDHENTPSLLSGQLINRSEHTNKQLLTRRHRLATTLQGESLYDPMTFTTLGWDTVFAVPVDKVNEVFSASGEYPTNFDYTLVGSLVTLTINGNFGPWLITAGGTGGLMNMKIPVANGTLTPVGGNPLSINGVIATVQVTLKYLEQQNAQEENGIPYNLKLNQSSPGSGVEPVVVLKIDNPNSGDETLNALLKAAIQGYLNAHLEQITYVFNTVNLNMKASSGAFAWLKPTTTDYAYYQDTAGNNQLFGVLCMVLDHSVDGLANQIAPAAVPDGQQSGFSISQSMFLQQMALPTLANAWDNNVDDSYFQLTGNNTKIVNTKDVPMKKITYALSDYYPVCQQFWMMVQGDTLVVYMKVHIPILPGIDAYAESTSYLGVKLGNNDQGEQTLSYYDLRPADKNSWVEKATWVIITEVIAGIIAACITFGVAKMLEGAVRIVVAIIVALVLGVAAAIPELIARIAGSGTTDKLPSISGMVTDATNAVVWPGGQNFVIKTSSLNGTLQLGGDAFA